MMAEIIFMAEKPDLIKKYGMHKWWMEMNRHLF